MQIQADFEVHKFDQQEPYDAREGAQLARARLEKSFRGAIEARSEVEMISARASTGGAGYVAMERIVGSVDGKQGSFVLLHAGTMTDAAGGDEWGVWPIVPGSGTGELVGIHGSAKITVDAQGRHTLTLDYEIDT